MAWFLTWVGHSIALGAMTALLVRVPAFRARAAARAAAWAVALAVIALLAVVPLLPPATASQVILTTPAPSSALDRAVNPVVIPAVPASWLLWGLAVWACGAVAWLAHASLEIHRVVVLKRACIPMSAGERARVGAWLPQSARGRVPQLCWCDDLDGPALLGFSNPIVAMPRAHGARLTDQELKHVLLHELAHVRRRDDWAACVELVLAGVLWTNPVVHVLRRSLGLAREMACDDWVVQHTAAPVAYARCLTTVAELRRRSRPARLASAATGSRSVLGRRVVRVLARDPRPSVRVSRAVAALTPVAVGCLAIMLIQTPPFVVDGRPATLALTSIAPQAAPEAAAGTNSGDLQSTVPNRPRIGIQLSTRIPVPDRQPTNAVDSPPVTGGGVDARGGSPTGDAALLSASPLPGTSVPGVIAIDGTVASDSIGPDVRTPWWGRAASVGAATGGGATSAGRVTASFFKRLGASVAKPLTR